MGMVAPENGLPVRTWSHGVRTRYHRAGKDLGNESPANLP